MLALALAWQLLRGDDADARARPGRVAACRGRLLDRAARSLWTLDREEGLDLPRRLRAPVRAAGDRLRPAAVARPRGCTWLWAALVATALALRRVSACYQWVTRDVFWNPKHAASATPTRRSSASTPSSGTRRSTAATSSVAILVDARADRPRRRARTAQRRGLYVVVVAIWVGLVFSFSQSSFIALAAGDRRRGRRRLGSPRGVAALVALGLLAARRRARGAAGAPRDRRQVAAAASTRSRAAASNLVSPGHPASPSTIRSSAIGVGGFRRAYAETHGAEGHDPKRVASHTTPITVAAEDGIVGLALLCWLARRGTRGDVAQARRSASRRGRRSRSASPSSRSPCTASSTPRSSRTRSRGRCSA